MSEPTKIQPRLVYSPEYDIRWLGLEKLHPFDSCKYSRTWKVLVDRFGDRLQSATITPTAPATAELLQTIHTPEYLQQLTHSRYIAQALELASLAWVPSDILDRHVLQPMRLATMGTVIAAKTALETGIGINLSGGYHHASRDRGSGFCVYSDIAISIASLRQSGQLTATDSIAIIDLDAHQGNGLARIFEFDRTVHILDMYNQDIYPQDRQAIDRIDLNLPLASGTRDDEYLNKLQQYLPSFLSQLDRPKIAFYNAGTDIYEDDPLGRLKISAEGVLARDRLVFQTLVAARIPVVMVLSGGYTSESYQLVARSVGEVLDTWGL
ncbi:histone deacetylase [Chamaesiphon sp. GL140_3_metabinner_50]|uniref:histone deacetylase family protein n=1 Tax=Chamaesiphon sp. GL140_3_metabinner_50 TaxID=2970812 RepID=UPI0025E12D41|nr:histone deacetylase [Chamaesiphon sp. GL140_3_metabinner_50]